MTEANIQQLVGMMTEVNGITLEMVTNILDMQQMVMEIDTL